MGARRQLNGGSSFQAGHQNSQKIDNPQPMMVCDLPGPIIFSYAEQNLLKLEYMLPIFIFKRPGLDDFKLVAAIGCAKGS